MKPRYANIVAAAGSTGTQTLPLEDGSILTHVAAIIASNPSQDYGNMYCRIFLRDRGQAPNNYHFKLAEGYLYKVNDTANLIGKNNLNFKVDNDTMEVVCNIRNETAVDVRVVMQLRYDFKNVA